MKRKTPDNCHGVIMMETLLVLPVYIVVLSGLFWLGEVSLTRLALTHGERLLLWQTGNRNGGSEVPASEVFRFLQSSSAQNKLGVVGSYSGFEGTSAQDKTAAAGWGRILSMYATVDLTRSAWSFGSSDFIVGSFFSGIRKNAVSQNLQVLARSKEENGKDTSLPSMVLFRRGDGKRKSDLDSSSPKKSSWSENTRWNQIYLGSWGDFIKEPQSQGNPSSAVISYSRDNSYVDWSE